MNEIETALQRARDTKALEFGEGAMERLPKMLEAQMEDSFIFKDPELYAEWSYLQQLEAYLKERDAVPVAVGSGVINDLTKLASHHLGRRYVIVGTAASMDGYTAYGASITYEGNKQTFDCPAPLGVVFDPAVAAKAPAGMSASGYADLLAKIPAGADWIISDAVGSEAIDDFAFNLVQKNLRKALSDPAAVADGDVEATGMLADGLIMSGFAMQAISSSRPASGTDHQFSHFWDMEGLCHNGRHVSHGFKVGIGTMVSTACLEFLISKDLTRLDIDACVAAWPTWEAQEAYIRKIFEGKPGHLARGLAESRAKYCGPEGIRCQLNAIVAVWPELRERIREQIIPFDDVKEMLRLVGAPSRPEEIGVSKARLRDTFKCIPFMRNRYTGIDLIYRAGLLDEVTEHIFGRGGRFEVK